MNIKFGFDQFLQVMVLLQKSYLVLFYCLIFVWSSDAIKTLFVKPTSNSSSCAEPCLTIDEYVDAISSSTSFIFLDGRHELDIDFTMTDMVNVSLRADSNASVSIDCGGQSRFLFNNVSGLVIKNIAFMSCGISSMTEPLPGISLHNLDQAELVNITITNSSSGALYIQGSTVTIMNILIHKNQASGTEGSFSGMKAEYSAIYMYGNNTFSQNLALIYGIHPLSTVSCFQIADVVNRGFIRNKMGPTLFSVNTSVHSYGTLAFTDNTSPSGIMNLQESSLVMSGRSVFSKNRVCFLGALAFTETDAKLSGEIIFSYNSAEFYSACLALNHSSLDVYGNIHFLGNSALTITSIIANASNIFIIGSLTNNNNTVIADPPGSESIAKAGILLLSNSSMGINGTAEFMNNHVDDGVIQIHEQSSLTAKNTSFINNVAVRGSCCLLVFDGSVQYSGNTLFSYNTGFRSALFSQGSPVVIEGSIKFFQNAIRYSNPNSIIYAGSIEMYSSQLKLQGEYVFENNEANNGLGGAIHALYSTLRFEGNGQFTNNTARNGGAIALLSCHITFKGNATFTNNTAGHGGAVYLVSSIITVEPQTLLEFESNSASQGGAIYVNVIEFGTENTQILENFSVRVLPPPCFLELNEKGMNKSFRFHNNTATDGGSALYGGGLDNCRLANQPDRPALDIFWSVSDFGDSNISIHQSCTSLLISSQPQSFCFCENNIPNCVLSTNTVDLLTLLRVFRGQSFSVSAIAFSQANCSIEGSVRSQLKSLPGNEMRSLNGNLQRLENKCTDLNYILYSENQREEVIMYANGVQGDGESAVLTLQVTFEDCPGGFVLVSDMCVCDERITKYGGTCNAEVGTITKAQNIWIGTHKDENNSYVGLILNRHCPFDYCIPPLVEFELSEPDSQCNHNRSGFLCGACKGNLSLGFGSSKCIECSNNHLALLILFAFLGVLLVILLFLFHLTIAHGTLHGLILYANIVNINRSVFGLQDVYFPFIAWLNLDFGFEICFYDGMDQLAKTWLQFVFPTYLLVLVGLIIVVCHCSIRASMFFVNMNPVAVLATIILLSYNKLLQITVEIFSYSVLEYPDNVKNMVWKYDGNVEQFTVNNQASDSWHALFAIALLMFVFLQFPYTFVLIFIQWLQKVPQISSCFNWLNVKLTPFVNVYHAPYKANSRFWLGLCLLLRLVLLIVSATVEETSANLLTISTFCFVLMSIIGTTRGVYTNRWLDVLEISFILNLGIFSAATYHNKLTEGNQIVTAYLSISVAFFTFLGIVSYHSFQRLMKITRFKKMVKVIKDKARDNFKKASQDHEIEENNDQQIQGQNRPRVTSQDLVISSDGVFEFRETLLEEK